MFAVLLKVILALLKYPFGAKKIVMFFIYIARVSKVKQCCVLG